MGGLARRRDPHEDRPQPAGDGHGLRTCVRDRQHRQDRSQQANARRALRRHGGRGRPNDGYTRHPVHVSLRRVLSRRLEVNYRPGGRSRPDFSRHGGRRRLRLREVVRIEQERLRHANRNHDEGEGARGGEDLPQDPARDGHDDRHPQHVHPRREAHAHRRDAGARGDSRRALQPHRHERRGLRDT